MTVMQEVYTLIASLSQCDPKWSCTHVVATRRNPSLKAKYDQLIRAGKSGKVAVTAIMRKLIVMANALLRDGRKWSELRP
jgi:hypothetical protein